MERTRIDAQLPMTQPPRYALPLAQLPLRQWNLVNVPGIPYWVDAAGDPDPTHISTTVAGLQQRAAEGMPAYVGLCTKYTIDDQTHSAYEFLYGSPLAPGATELALDQADDYTLAWTSYGDVYADSQDMVGPFAKTLQSTTAATQAFWPTIASFGLPFNMLVLEKVDDAQATVFATDFGNVWASENLGALQKAGLLYAIDMSILASLEPFTARDGSVRFAPGTITLLEQDPKTKALSPAAILISTTNSRPRVYGSSDPAWLYALQAAKASVTVWGIWLGHAYQWHVVTAAMQMTMYNHLPADNRLWPLLKPQSQFLIDFDYVLMTTVFGKISPPTPVGDYMTLLTLFDEFAAKRKFFDDDPHTALKKAGIEAKDFNQNKDWDAYPVVGFLLDIWTITHGYVKAVVDDLYKNDGDVASDTGLKAWMDASRDPSQGNLKDLPDVKTRDELTKVLTSLLYRVTVHGAGSLTPSVNPALAFVANFPPCLQSADIPEPGTPVSPADILPLLPHTGTIGGMTTFVYTFAYSAPYVPLIPPGGVNTTPYFPPSQNQCNAALFKYRQGVKDFVDTYVKDWNAALARFRGAPPGAPPSYALGQYQQWPLSIEI
jgi:hypothetical protein